MAAPGTYAEELAADLGRVTYTGAPGARTPQVFINPVSVRTPFGQLRFTSSDTVNVTQKRVSETPLAVERVIIQNRSADDTGTATNGNTILVGGVGGNLLGPSIAVGGAIELLNVDLSDIRIAYGGTASLTGVQIVIVGWVAHGFIRYGQERVTAVNP